MKSGNKLLQTFFIGHLPFLNANKKAQLFISLVLLLFSQQIFAQSIIDTAAIKKELSIILERDQKTRTKGDSVAFVNYIDSCNQVYVKALIDKYGWPGKNFVGAKGNQTVFLVIQHADSATQEKYFPLLQKSVEQNESSVTDMALMQDRILMRRGEKQIYGSQIVSDGNGGWKFYQIEDEKNVNFRRAKIGLQPIEEYAKYFGIDYKLPE